jgi:hypothetical protein
MGHPSKSQLFYWIPEELVFDYDSVIEMGWSVWLSAAKIRTPLDCWDPKESLRQFQMRFPSRSHYLQPGQDQLPSGGLIDSLRFLKAFSKTLLSADTSHLLLEDFKQGITRDKVLSALEHAMPRATSDRALQRRRAILSQPDRCTRLVFRVAFRLARRQGVLSFEFRLALAVLVLSIVGLAFAGHCKICFRKALAWTHRCDLHSRSKITAEIEKERRPGIHLTKRISTVLKWVSPPNDLFSSSLLKISIQFSEVAWPRTNFETDRWHQQIIEVLLRAPTVASILPVHFNEKNQWCALLALREALDPLEFNPSAWPRKIEVAEAWLTYEKILKNRVHGPRELTRTRRDQALALIAGGMSVKLAANQLKVSDKNLFNILRRHSSRV